MLANTAPLLGLPAVARAEGTTAGVRVASVAPRSEHLGAVGGLAIEEPGQVLRRALAAPLGTGSSEAVSRQSRRAIGDQGSCIIRRSESALMTPRARRDMQPHDHARGSRRWAIRWAKRSRIGPYQARRHAPASLRYVACLQAFSRSMLPRTPCFTRERSQVRNPPRPSSILGSAAWILTPPPGRTQSGRPSSCPQRAHCPRRRRRAARDRARQRRGRGARRSRRSPARSCPSVARG